MAISQINTNALASSAVTSAKLASGSPARSNLPAGSVLQVVNATYSTETTVASGTYADTGLTASITPTSSSSKILVVVQQAGVDATSASNGINLRLLRGSTSIAVFALSYNYNGYSIPCSAGICYLDSPATTSSTSYKTQQARSSGAGNSVTQSNSAVSTITLMEIAA